MSSQPSLPPDLLALNTMTLATVSINDEPHAAAVYFSANPDFHFFFLSENSSQHSLDLAANPHAAVTIQAECDRWQNIHGLQMRGLVNKIETGETWQQGWKLYRQKFPFVNELASLLLRHHLYEFVPTWIRLVDNRRSFGFKQEWTLP
jgi:uncharacterized protein YhbP (UPF0306 family)